MRDSEKKLKKESISQSSPMSCVPGWDPETPKTKFKRFSNFSMRIISTKSLSRI